MNNKSFLKMMGRSIKGSLARFIAIVGITALGAGFLAGLMATSPDMKESANAYFESAKLYDFYVQSTLGFSEENIIAMEKEPYIKQVMAIEQKDQFLTDDEGESLETRVFHIDFEDEDLLNRVHLIEGRMPKNGSECLIEIPNKYSYETKLGKKYKDKDGKIYTVSGIVKSPLFVSSSGEPTNIGKGSISLAIYVKQEKKPEIYTAAYAISDVKSRDTFSKEYKKQIDKNKEKLEDFGKEQVKERYDEIVGEAQEKLDKNKEKYLKEKKDVNKKLKDAKETLNHNKNLLEEGLSKVNNGISQVDSGINKISNGQNQINSGIVQIDQGIKKIDNAIKKIDDGLKQVNSGIAYLKNVIRQLEDQLLVVPPQQQGPIKEKLAACEGQLKSLESQQQGLNAQKNKLLAQKKQLLKKKSSLNGQYQELVNKKASLMTTKTDLINKRAEIQNGQIEIKNGFAELQQQEAKAKREFLKAEKNLDDAQRKIDDIKEGEWIISSRIDSNGINSYLSDIDKIKAIADIFPVFFFLVAALVVLTTMTRMIEEERGQVGILKSLGYDNSIIRGYYLFYGTIATIVGSVLGLCAGFAILPKVISNAYGMMYNLPETRTPFRFALGAVIVLLILLSVMITILYACKNELKEKPALLLQPKAPEAGKRILLEKITPIWNRLKFTRKITLRNLFRYKKRFLMTIIGVAGCFALLITGFGIRDSIEDIVELQFGELTTYDVSVVLDKDNNWQPKNDIYDEVGAFSTNNITIKNGDLQEAVSLTVPSSIDEMKTFVDLRERTSKKKIKLKDGELYLSEKLREICDVDKGDTVILESEGKDDIEMKVSGFFENYVGNVAYVNKNTYEDIYNEKPSFNTLYLNISKGELENKDMDDVVREIMDEDNVKFAMATDTIRKNFNDSVKNIDYIVWVLIICAGALSVIVLYNLTNINICERKKELATIKVLGFFDNEVRGYIFREVYLLSFIGILVGIPCGLLLHRFVIRTAEVGGMMFGRNIYLDSFALSIMITLAFTVLVSFIMRRSIKNIDMVESMKATD